MAEELAEFSYVFRLTGCADDHSCNLMQMCSGLLKLSRNLLTRSIPHTIKVTNFFCLKFQLAQSIDLKSYQPYFLTS